MEAYDRACTLWYYLTCETYDRQVCGGATAPWTAWQRERVSRHASRCRRLIPHVFLKPGTLRDWADSFADELLSMSAERRAEVLAAILPCYADIARELNHMLGPWPGEPR